MKTITKEFTVYDHNDLQAMPSVRDRAIKNLQQSILQDGVELDFTIQYWQEKLKKLGFLKPQIFYSISYSQDDGASFTCKYVDYDLLIDNYKEQMQLTSREIKAIKYISEYYGLDGYIIRKQSYYCHEHTVQFCQDYGYLDSDCKRVDRFIYNTMEKLENFIDQLILSISKEIFNDLKKDYEYYLSDEYIMEIIKINDYQFLENGKIFA